MKIERNYCNCTNCPKYKNCGRAEVNITFENDTIITDVPKPQDYWSICKGEILYLDIKEYGQIKNGRNLTEYIDLFNFYDTICPNNECSFCEIHKGISTKVPCKKGIKFNCNHNEHPDNKKIMGMMTFQNSVKTAFEKAGIKYGKVEFTCPICGGKAYAEKHHTPKETHKVTIRQYCSACGFNVIN